jgi:hypothetical protein
MRNYRDAMIVLSIWATALFFDATLYRYLHHYYNYLIVIGILSILLFILKKKIALRYAYVGAVGLAAIVLYGVLDSPYRLSRVEEWMLFLGT